MKRIRIGLLGCGTVGGGFVRLVARERPRILARFGVELEIARILVRDADKPRPGIDPAILTTAALDVLDDDCDLIVEVVGGVQCKTRCRFSVVGCPGCCVEAGTPGELTTDN
jgi:homoserine dehydrogenase